MRKPRDRLGQAQAGADTSNEQVTHIGPHVAALFAERMAAVPQDRNRQASARDGSK